MPTGIRFPSQLRVPDREGYNATFEETRSVVDMEAGPARRRNKYRRPPQLFDLQWTFNQADFTVFDIWWQDTIGGGTREFDIQLLDDDETVVWYTVTAKGEYKAEVSEVMDWRVTLRVKALGANFGPVRPAGTDELMGLAEVGVTARGMLLIPKVLRGSTSVGITAQARFSLPPLRGAASVGLFRLPRARFGAFPLRGAAAVGVTASGALQVGP